MRVRLKKQKSSPRKVGRQRRSTDLQSPTAFSYHAQRAERSESTGRQQPNLAEQRSRVLSLQFLARRSGFLLVLIVAIVCVLSVLSLSNTPRIVLLTSGANNYAFHQTSDYQQAAAKDLSSSIWNRNKITVNTGAASARLQQQFPELASVSVTLPLVGHRPIYYLRANAPSFVFQAVNGTYVLDSSGTALLAKAAAPAASVATLPVITDQTGLHVQLGHQAISADNASFITTVMAELAAKGVVVSALDLPANAAQELDVHIGGEAYYVKFNMHDSSGARSQAGTYLATIANLTKQGLAPSQYIDVRVIGRAYYQ